MGNRNLRYVIVCLAVLVGGCAVGNTHRYHDTIADFSGQGSILIAVTTSDQREYVVSRDKGPSFVGLQRGGFGNPFNVNTDTGKPLAEDMTQSIANSLVKKGFKVNAVVLNPPTEKGQVVIDKLKKTGAERLFLLTLTEWKSDSMMNTALLFDVEASVLDREGKTLAAKRISGKDDLGGSAWNPPAHAKEAVPKAFKDKIEQLLNSPEIGAALR